MLPAVFLEELSLLIILGVLGQIPHNQPGQAGADVPLPMTLSVSLAPSHQQPKKLNPTDLNHVFKLFCPYLGAYAKYLGVYALGLGVYAHIQELMLNIQELMLTYLGVYATCGLSRGAFAPNNSGGLGQIPHNQPGQAGADDPYL